MSVGGWDLSPLRHLADRITPVIHWERFQLRKIPSCRTSTSRIPCSSPLGHPSPCKGAAQVLPWFVQLEGSVWHLAKENSPQWLQWNSFCALAPLVVTLMLHQGRLSVVWLTVPKGARKAQWLLQTSESSVQALCMKHRRWRVWRF